MSILRLRRWSRGIALLMAMVFLAALVPAVAQTPPPLARPAVPVPAVAKDPAPGDAPPPAALSVPAAADTNQATAGGDKLISIKFNNAPLDQVLAQVEQMTGRIMLKQPGLNATVTLRAPNPMPRAEAMQALQSVLTMNNVALVPMGERFMKVVPIASAPTEAPPINIDVPAKGFVQADQLISQIITLKFMAPAELQAAIQGLLHPYAKVQILERINSILITETENNLRRVLEVIDYLDKPSMMKVETRIYELRYAKASDISGRLNELVASSQEQAAKTPAAGVQVMPPGIMRPGRGPGAAAAAAADIEQAERGIITGKVKIVADERTNILIIISEPANFTFFDKIVAILDRPTEPEAIVRVMAMEYADATEVAGILNDFIGAANSGKSSAPTTPKTTDKKEGDKTTDTTGTRAAKTLTDFAVERAAARTTPEGGPGEKSKIGQISSNTKIMADKRTNSLLLMGTKGDLQVLQEIVSELDVMLAQVMIESVILEVALNSDISYGMDWLQRSMSVYTANNKGKGGGLDVGRPVYSFAGGTRVAGNTANPSLPFQDAASLSGRGTTLGPGLTYYMTFSDLNLDAVIRATAGSSDGRILSTPVIVTTDNTKAKLVATTEKRVAVNQEETTGGNPITRYDYKSAGIELEITPRINPRRIVSLEITQQANNFTDPEGNEIRKREMTANISVEDRSTIILGGLVDTVKSFSRTKIPLLGDIPLLGALFRYDSRRNDRTELMVLLTPYVLMTPDEARSETVRINARSVVNESEWYNGWSDGDLARQLRAKEKRPWWDFGSSKPPPVEAEKPRSGPPLRETGLTITNRVGPRVTYAVPSQWDLSTTIGAPTGPSGVTLDAAVTTAPPSTATGSVSSASEAPLSWKEAILDRKHHAAMATNAPPRKD